MTEHMAFRFDWDDIAGRTVTEILGLDGCVMNDGTARWDSVAFCTGPTALVLNVEPNTDQIILSHEPSPQGHGWEPIPSLGFAKGRALGWCWIGINSQGYKDSVTIAFGKGVPDVVVPRCTFITAASSLSCFDLVPHRAR